MHKTAYEPFWAIYWFGHGAGSRPCTGSAGDAEAAGKMQMCVLNVAEEHLQGQYCWGQGRFLHVAPGMELLAHANQEDKGGNEAVEGWRHV